MPDVNRRIVIAGGSGFIGRALSRALLAKGCQVTILSRGPSRLASGAPDGPVAAMQQWDGQSAKGWGHLADGAYALVNLAGEDVAGGRWSAGRKERILESRLGAGRAMLEAVSLARVKPQVLVQASAVGYYGDTGDAPLDESAPAGQGFLAHVATRWEASTAAVEAMGVRRAVIRTGLVLGKNGGILSRMVTPFRWFLGSPFGSGQQGFPWVHLEDEVRAIQFLLENPAAQGPFNLTAPQSVSNAEFCRALASALKRPCGPAVPALALRLILGDMAQEMLLSGCRPFPKRLLELGFMFEHPKLDDALRRLLT